MTEMEKVSTVFFDLDGTLLPLDEKQFMVEYLARFTQRCITEQLDPGRAQEALMAGVMSMQGEGGRDSNMERFWRTFFSHLSLPYDQELISSFTRFYNEEFREIRHLIEPTPLSAEIVSMLKAKGYDLILATAPMFPRAGTLERMSWIGLEETDFSLITTYEDYSYTKPHVGYYQELFDKTGVQPEEVLMIGNNVREDGAIRDLGSSCLFITDHLINPDDTDLSSESCLTLRELHALCASFPERVKEKRA